jgi:outer membrane protein assembly factor BamD (BamD/ComL family)
MQTVNGGVLVTMIVLATAGGRAAAQPGPPAGDAASACNAAEQALRDARATGGAAARLDEALYNAGVCREEHGDADDAIAAYAELRTRAPRSPLAPRALARTGAVEARRAHYAEAATALEEYARLYPGERDAPAALTDAVYYRASLGDDARAIAGAERYLRTYGGRHPAEAARVHFGLTTIYERRGKPAELIAHLRSYLKRFGDRGGGDRLVIAYSRLGQLLWDASCMRATVDGACVTLGPARAAQCGPISRRPVKVRARDARKVREAIAAFAAAVTAYERRGGRFPGGDELTARHAYARARFHQAEVTFEAYLALGLPAGLDFDPARPAAVRRSRARFSAWLADKQRVGGRASAAYERLITEVKDPAHAIAAAARVGQIAANLGDALYTAEIPASLRADRAAVDAYCDALTGAAEPLEQRAMEAYAVCLRTAGDVGLASSWAALCERELGLLRPDEFPRAAELRAQGAPPSTSSGPAPTIAGPP